MRSIIKKIIKFKSSNNAVSETLGTVLLLGMSVAIFSILYFVVLSQAFETNEPYPTVVSTIIDDEIVFEHRGGDSVGLEATVPLTIDGQKVLINGNPPTVEDLLIDSNGNDKWDVGETLNFNFYDFDYTIDSEEIDATAINEEQTDTIFMGSLDIHPTSDIGIQCSVNNTAPHVGENIEITITVTHFRGNLNITDLDLKFVLPNSLKHISNTTSNGNYSDSAGNWRIDLLEIRRSETLTVIAKVISEGTLAEYTQLALLLDGSGSISSYDWDIMCDGLALAIANGKIPHNEMVELTVIQFGGSSSETGRTWAQVELGGPIVLDNSNFNTVATNIQSINQLGGGTAMSCSFRLVADVLSGDPNGYLSGTDEEGMASIHSDWPRQVVNLVTDGQPNIIYDHPDRYGGWWAGLIEGRSYEYIHGKENTQEALTYFESLITIDESEGDEIDAVAVGDDTDIEWLRDYIVRPQPGYDNWPPTGPGWVRYVSDYTEFAQTIDEQFELIFSGINLKPEMASTNPIDITIQVYTDVTLLPEG